MKDYDDLLIALRRITRAIDLHSKKLQKLSGLTTSQLLVIEAIDKLENPNPSSIAREILLSQGTVTNLIDRMEKRGLVKREKSDNDKRSVKVTVTKDGLSRYQDAPDLLQDDFLAKFRKLDSWEQHLMLSSVERIASMMDAEEEIDASPILTTGEIGTDNLPS
ncbi:MAG: MarR family transcriptional regulator [Gammaproteobacteria bacterium]|nr:MarR family transcriptional regulator [Gammaproteobacteria bacterium]